MLLEYNLVLEPQQYWILPSTWCPLRGDLRGGEKGNDMTPVGVTSTVKECFWNRAVREVHTGPGRMGTDLGSMLGGLIFRRKALLTGLQIMLVFFDSIEWPVIEDTKILIMVERVQRCSDLDIRWYRGLQWFSVLLDELAFIDRTIL